ncbi:hypothetical protein [Nocardioides lianchengensis]|uniref:Uncharacterized protein n=1 Tax=Nocardioides lianchengensis TaxID=1045774 RepID=A0A1G6LUS7_9ACTN|nr:hypothetical protein [Nocardioides lianchengensis]NYG12439.1 hypothetical protein [Nocardioides lianchengensis]SDC46959.1 hypothetical protein SAMN05421872_102365 [Nocardioides lianchengensis]
MNTTETVLERRSYGAGHRENDAHISLRYDVPAKTIAKYVARVVRAEQLTSFTTTETGARMRRLIARELGAGWIVTRSGEYVIAVKRSVYRRHRWVLYRRWTRAYKAEREAWRDLWGHFRIFVHRQSGALVALGALHPPARVQQGSGWNEDDNPLGVLAHHQGMRKVGRWVGRAENRWPGIVIRIGIDTNLDLRIAEFRTYLHETTGLDTMWDSKRPPAGQGSHDGGRVIDARLSNARMSDPHLVPGELPSVVVDGKRRRVDHRAVAGVLHIPEAA